MNRTNYATSQDIWPQYDWQRKYRFSTKNSSCLRLTRQLNKRFFVSWERKWNLKIYFYVVVKNCVPRIHLAVYNWKYYMETNVIIISKQETDWLICHFEWLYGWRTIYCLNLVRKQNIFVLKSCLNWSLLRILLRI